METPKVKTKVKIMTRIALPIAGTAALVAAMICLDVSPSQAQYYGDAPWCAVISIGTGSVHWDCEYNTVEACVPNVLAGNRGFCGNNPYYTGPRPGTAAVAHHPRYRSHKYAHQH